MATKKKMLQAAAGVGGVPEGAWDLSYAYYDDPNGWDLSTAVYSNKNFSVATQETTPESVFFKPDGTKMYVTGSASDNVNEYDLSTAWDVSSASYNQAFSVATQISIPKGIFFKPDGLKMYVLDASGDDVNEYSLSTAWNVSTSSYVQNFSVVSQDASPQGIFFKPDGTKMYMIGQISDNVNEYDLSTAWDVSTASYLQSYSVTAQEANPTGVFFKPDGTKMYISGSSGDDINEYSLSTAWDISTASYFQVFSVASQDTVPSNLFFKPDGLTLYVVGATNDAVFQYTLGGFSVAAQETSTTGLFFNPDGTKMYIVGQIGDAVYEYDLSTAWDTSTASYTQTFSVAAQETIPQDVFFKPDGTKMYVIGRSGDDVNEYSLSTAWDVSTASYAQNFSVAAQEISPTGLFFNPDGTKMYVIGYTSDNVNQYDLSTAWDVSTASYVQNFSVASQEPVPLGVFFKPDGTKMYVIGAGGDAVYEYDLSTAWDVSTATYLQLFSVANQDIAPQGLFFKPDGIKMYVMGDIGDAVYSYTLGVQP